MSAGGGAAERAEDSGTSLLDPCRTRVRRSSSVWLIGMSASSLAIGGCAGEVAWVADPGASEVAPHGDSWDPADYAPKVSPPPLRAARWDWPAGEEFQKRSSLWAMEAWSLGVLIGRQGSSAEFGGKSRLGELELRLARRGEREHHSLLESDGPHTCRGWSPHRSEEPILAGDPFSTGQIELRSFLERERRFAVQSVAPPRALTAEDWRDWVYARTIVYAGLGLARANRETATAEGKGLCMDDATDVISEECWHRTKIYELERTAELATACYESGLVACYLAARLALVDEWTLLARSGIELPKGLEPGSLARGPLALDRFFAGLLIDTDSAEPAFVRACWDIETPIWLALAIADTSTSALIMDGLQRRALDPGRDVWTRIRIIQVLSALGDIDTRSTDTGASLPAPHSLRYADSFCALGLFVWNGWTTEEARARCIEKPQQIWRDLDRASGTPAVRTVIAARRQHLADQIATGIRMLDDEPR